MTVRITKPEFNLREKLSELDKPVGLHGNEILKSETPQDTFDLVGTGRKNMVINGDMRISQRYNTDENTPTNNKYTLDQMRWDMSTSSKFKGTQTDCYGGESLDSTSGEWKTAELKFANPAAVNNIYSFQLNLSAANVAVDFEVNDISIVFKTKRTK